MNFEYSDEQCALQDTLQKFIAREYAFDRRRRIAESELGYSAEAWKQYAELGLLALPVPEPYGGLSGSAVDTMLVMEQFGAGLLLEPYVSTVVVCAGLLNALAAEPMKREWLPRIVSGHGKLALAAYEAAGRYDLCRAEMRATPTGDGWRLNGSKAVVLDAPSADAFLVTARVEGGLPSGETIALFLVPASATGVRSIAYRTQSGGRAADLVFDGVHCDRDAMIDRPGETLTALECAIDRGAAALCAEAVGIMGVLNNATLEYLKSRKQFGVPIGSFQALKHKMADSLIAAEQSRSMAIIAAIQADAPCSVERRRSLAAAKAYIGQAGRLVGQQAVQMHGGMGVVDELSVSHYFKRLSMIDVTFGDAEYQLARFSDAMSPAKTNSTAA